MQYTRLCFPIFYFSPHTPLFSARTQGLYKMAGRMVALLIVHGGVSPNFMSQSLYEVIAHGFDACKPKLEDVADYEIRAQISSVSSIGLCINLG